MLALPAYDNYPAKSLSVSTLLAGVRPKNLGGKHCICSILVYLDFFFFSLRLFVAVELIKDLVMR